jgi:hypothetical protein
MDSRRRRARLDFRREKEALLAKLGVVRRSLFLLAPILTALGLALSSSACFQEEAAPCAEGSQGCPCLQLQCEAGLACQNSICVAMDANSSSATTSTETATVSSSSTENSNASETSSATSCGNGILEDGEECDNVPGCTECQLDNWECNPLNNEPCPDGWKCSYHESEPGVPTFTCRVFVDPPPGQLHEQNCYNVEPLDEWCDVGLACVTTNVANACIKAGANCCVEFCDLADQAFVCGEPSDDCVPFWNGTPPSGLNNLGFCGVPVAPRE